MERGDFKISFCVVCMNRLHQLKQTLIQNILDNADYEDLEFVVLDYNSKDGMEEWAKENLAQYIKTGRVVYYRTTDPESWNPSHSKNLAFKLATGDIVCSIWADYYTGAEFAQYVNDSFKADDNIVLTPIDFHRIKKNYAPPGDVLGKVCVKKSDFLKIEGFDERMDRHGFEDYDFVNRLEIVGVKRVLIDDFAYLKYISHGNDERYSLPKNLSGMYVKYISASESEVLFLYNNQCFDKGTVIDNYTAGSENYIYAYAPRKDHFEYSLKETSWLTGVWQKNNNVIIFSTGDKFSLDENTKHLTRENEADTFYHIIDTETVKSVLTFQHFFYTRSIMEESLKNNIAIVNNAKFGKATVFKNFALLSVPIS